MDAQALLEEAARLRDSDMPLCDAARRCSAPRVATKGRGATGYRSRVPCASLVRRERARKPSKRPKRSSRPTPVLTWLTSGKASGPRISPGRRNRFLAAWCPGAQGRRQTHSPSSLQDEAALIDDTFDLDLDQDFDLELDIEADAAAGSAKVNRRTP